MAEINQPQIQEEEVAVSTATHNPIIYLPQLPNNHQLIFDPTPYESSYHIAIEYLKHSYFHRALSLTNPTVPEIYIQQMWQTMKIDDQDRIEGGFAPPEGEYACEVFITKRKIAKIFQLPSSEMEVEGQWVPNPALVANPSSTEIVNFLFHLGYSDELTSPSKFKRQNIPPIWNVIITILVKCLSGKSGSQDQANIRFLTILYGLYYDLTLDYTDLLFQDMKNAVKYKSKSKHLCYPRFLSIFIHKGIQKLGAPLNEPFWKQHVHTVYRPTVLKEGYRALRPLSRYMLNQIPEPSLLLLSYLSSVDFLANGFESKFIDSISKEILKVLCREPLHVGENLVGVDAHVNEMNLVHFVGSNKVHMIGICGISGIGKTTLAKAIYNLMCSHFEECVFCEDVAKQQGITQVQMQLIAKIMKTRVVEISSVSEGTTVIKQRMPTKPILLVLDGMDHRDQLEALAGSPNWFSPGSLIIFTGKDKQLLRSHKVDEIYDMPVLLDHNALELFSLYAFGENHPTKDFIGVSNQVVDCLQGHPLALRVLGCSLYEKPLSVWKSELERLKMYPNAEIQQKLRPSFNGLDFDQQRIFLDIAYSFIGENKDFAASVINNEDCTEDANIDVLVDKSLITISSNDNSLQMHDLIRSMAWEIVREESNSPGRRSRLWIVSDVRSVLNENKASETVEVLDLLQEESNQKVHIDGKAFARMKNLRILKICDKKVEYFGHTFDLKLWKDFKMNYSGRLEFLSNKLRLFYWHGCPFKFFPSDFYPENIVAIDLSYSRIENLWTTPKCFGRLKVMKLSHCRNLKSAPDFTLITNLKELILEGCVNLVNFHPSFGMLKRLVVLNMRDCKRFRRFPNKVEMDSLEVLIISGCSKVDKLPDSFGTIQNLKEFLVDGTAITELPSYVLSQCNLQALGFGPYERIWSRRWTSISHLSWFQSKMQRNQSPVMMPSLESLCSLKVLNFSGCNILEVPDSIGGLSCLVDLSLDGNNFTSLLGCLSQLPRLQYLSVIGCKKLEELPELPPTIFILDANECTSLQEVPNILLNHDKSTRLSYFRSCPKLFWNDTYESQSEVSMLQPQPVNSSIASHSSRNHLFHSFLRYTNFPSNTNGFFTTQKTNFLPFASIIYHGNRIPQWFANRSTGNHVKVDLPPDWCISKFRGYGICVVFTPKKSHGGKYDAMRPTYCVHNFDGTSLFDGNRSYHGSLGFHKSYSIWFNFVTTVWGWDKSKNFVTFSFKDNDDVVEVKECGVRLVFDEDIEEEEQNLSFIRDLPAPTQDGGSILTWWNYRHFQWSW